MAKLMLARLIIGPDSASLKAESLEANLSGDTAKAVELLAEAKLREKRFETALQVLRN